jgi:8-hydroxy-5-deazaflavin:NADPH oxidoreductase
MSKSMAIIGTGNMGSGLAKSFAKAGIFVTIGSREIEKARALASAIGNSEAASIRAAVESSDTIVLAVPYAAIEETLAQAGDLSGKVIIDITNPITPDYMSLTIGHTTSAGEEIQKRAPGATVIKAYNTIFAQLLTYECKDGEPPVQVLYATDDKAAGERFAELVRATGFEPVYSGALSNARYLEPLAELNIHFGYALGAGVYTAPAWIKFAG